MGPKFSSLASFERGGIHTLPQDFGFANATPAFTEGLVFHPSLKATIGLTKHNSLVKLTQRSCSKAGGDPQ